MRLLLFFVVALVITSCTRQPASKLLTENSDVTLDTPGTGEIKKDGADTFRINVMEKAFITGYADQKNADVTIEVLGRDKKVTNTYDESAFGPDPFFFNTDSAGIYYIVIKPFREAEGKYELHLTGAEAIATDPVKRVDQITGAMIQDDGPGASVAVMKDNQIVYSKGFGHANLEYDIRNTPQTIFHIASVSKQFVGFSIAMLADQGKVNMNDDVRKYLPELHDFGTPITLNHLVHHTSGLRDQWNLLALAGWRLDDVITQKQIMRLVSRQRELNFQPGEEMLYCNTGFTLLAEVVSRVTGQPFPEWTKENIFKPLEMNNTLFYDDHEKLVPGRAYSYYKKDTIYQKAGLNYANFGATSLFTTVEDLCKWAMNFETMKVGNQHVMNMMEERFVLNKGDTMSYGYGMGIGKYKGLKTVSHGGSDAGYRTYLLRFPEQHFAVVVFSNLASFSPGGLSFAIADAYLSDQYKEEPKKEEASAPPAPEEKKIAFDPSAVKLAEYTGRYYSEELQTFYDFEVMNDTLVAHHQRHNDIKTWPQRPDGFGSGAWWTGDIQFTRDAKGKVDGLKIDAGRVRHVDFRKTSN